MAAVCLKSSPVGLPVGLLSLRGNIRYMKKREEEIN